METLTLHQVAVTSSEPVSPHSQISLHNHCHLDYDDQPNHHIQENMIYDCIQHLSLVEDLLVILGVLCAFSEEKLSNLHVVLGQECKI